MTSADREAEVDVMHDLDRAMFESGNEQEYGYESAQLEQEEFLNVLGEVLGESNGASPRGALGRRSSAAPSGSSAQDETDETELALELLQVNNEEELEGFFSGLIDSAFKKAENLSDYYKKNVPASLRSIATTAVGGLLPAVGQGLGLGLGTAVDKATGGTGWGEAGAKLGKGAGAAAKGWLGWELEGLSQEDREFETARTLVHWAKDAAQRAAAMTPQTTARPSAAGGAARQVPPAQIAKAAAVAAAQRVAPGLAEVVRQMPVRSTGAGGAASGEQSGRWTRRGNTVVLHGF
jgi:hypothetical protein